MPDLMLKRVQEHELQQYQPYLVKFHEFWVVGIAFRVAGLGWKFYDELADVISYDASEMSEMYELPRRVMGEPPSIPLAVIQAGERIGGA